MEIKSSLINSDDMKFVKNSLIKVSEKDNEEEFRVKALEYINDTSDEKDDKFFYDMLEFVRFLDPDDEATAYTDPENEAIIQKSVAQLVKDKTLIVIAHRLSTVKDADKLYVIKDGVIDSSGTHEELLAKGGLYKKMWEAHIGSRDE